MNDELSAGRPVRNGPVARSATELFRFADTFYRNGRNFLFHCVAPDETAAEESGRIPKFIKGRR